MGEFAGQASPCPRPDLNLKPLSPHIFPKDDYDHLFEHLEVNVFHFVKGQLKEFFSDDDYDNDDNEVDFVRQDFNLMPCAPTT